MNDVVLPRRLALQQFELNKQRRQLEEQQRAFQEQQRQFEEQKSKEIVAESVTSKPLTGWEHTGWESAKKKHTKRVQDRKNLSSWIPPGFRTKKWWKMLPAGLFYVFLLYTFLSASFDDPQGIPISGVDLWLNRITYLLVFILPLFFLANYRNIRNRISAPANPVLRWIVFGVIAVILFVLPVVILLAIEAVFF